MTRLCDFAAMGALATFSAAGAFLGGCPPGVIAGGDAGNDGGAQIPDASGIDGGSSDAGTSVDGGTSADSGVADAGSSEDFPATSIIYQDVSGAALDPQSTAIIDHLADGGGWGTSTHNFQIDFSLAVLHADSSVQPRAFTPTAGYYSPDCDMTLVPVPPGGNIEGSTDYSCDPTANDCHLLVYQGRRLYELYHATIAGGQATGSPFTTDCEVIWDLTYDYWQPRTPYSRGDQCTSADAAGMPIAPLLVTGAELQAGIVRHAMRFTLPNPEIRSGVYLHPGTHAGGPSGDSLMPAYTSRFRLRSTFDVTTLPSAGAVTIARALQTYGMFLDDGGNIPLTVDQTAAAFVGSHDLAALKVTDFEIVASPDPPIALTDNCTRTPITDPNNMP